jgi:hypothetical protein
MLGLLERSIASIEDRLILLVPGTGATTPFRHVANDAAKREAMLREMQQLRGSIYLEDGAITPKHLSADGRHQTPEDDVSWHLLMTNARREISACVWYREHEPGASMDALRVRDCPLRKDSTWRDLVSRAVHAELATARRESLRYVEVGGWAVSKASRGAVEGLILALGAFSLGRLFGGALGMTTATVRHCSSTILRRLGGSHFEIDGRVVPPYYDPRYDCTMELLRFDSRRPTARYADLVAALEEKLAHVAVFANALGSSCAMHSEVSDAEAAA